MKKPKEVLVIEVHVGEPTADGKCSACNGEMSPARGNSTVGSTRAFREGYDDIDWGGVVSESVRKAQKAHLN